MRDLLTELAASLRDWVEPYALRHVDAAVAGDAESAWVEHLFKNVWPNCGGGLVLRPIRPSRNWKGDKYFGKDPAGSRMPHGPVGREAIRGRDKRHMASRVVGSRVIAMCTERP